MNIFRARSGLGGISSRFIFTFYLLGIFGEVYASDFTGIIAIFVGFPSIAICNVGLLLLFLKSSKIVARRGLLWLAGGAVLSIGVGYFILSGLALSVSFPVSRWGCLYWMVFAIDVFGVIMVVFFLVAYGAGKEKLRRLAGFMGVIASQLLGVLLAWIVFDDFMTMAKDGWVAAVVAGVYVALWLCSFFLCLVVWRRMECLE